MADLTVRAVVARLDAAIQSLADWSLSPMPVSLVVRNARPKAHLAAHAMAIQTGIRAGGVAGRRANLTEGAYVDTTATVEWSYRIRVDAYASDLRMSYDAEADLLKALMAVSMGDLHVWPVSMSRLITDDRSHVVGAIALRCTHSIALQ